ncbi:MAG: hypothetical protein LQ343_007919 [Gyalolechia ehrenbergii]|nr:MAG: hypothetical protein LQ343_007919 [Gyalolechia ehrenbergii]
MPRGRPRKHGFNSSPMPGSSQPQTTPSTTTRKASTQMPISRRQSSRTMREVKNSSDVDIDMDEEDPLNLVKHEPDDEVSASEKLPGAEAAHKVLKAVSIPANSFKVPPPRERPVPSRSPSSMGSALSSVRGYSSEYETPGTSAVVTPAESLGKGPRSFGRPSTSTRPSLLGVEEDEIKAKGKRKRDFPGANHALEADAVLAQALQEEEYFEDLAEPSKARRAPKTLILDSDDDMDPLSDLSDAASDEVSIKDESSRRKRPKLNQRSSLPSRYARDNAKRSIRQKAWQLPDSDGEPLASDLSEFGSEVDPDDLDDESEAIEDGIVDSNATSRAVSVQPAATPAITPATSSRAAARAAARARRRGGASSGRPRVRGWRTRMAERIGDRAAKERHKLERAHPEIKTMWDELKKVPTITPVMAEQPSTITRKLKSFQLEGLDWMMKQEKSQWRGGLLGDEMGMGKTIQAVSLIMSDYPAQNPTLVVVPPVALMQWQNEIKEYTDGKLKVLVYHNTNPQVKKMKLKELKGYDVIMISYSGLESIYRKESKGWKRDDGIIKENSKIHAIHYHRLILDEAHNIKSRTTGVARACFALKADHKWCLSGTPVQNRIGEFFSLLRFLEIKPFACYFCKACSCAELHWSQSENKKCTHCDHSGFNHVSIFNQELLNPITQGSDDELRREGLAKLRLVTDRIMLRRVKRDHTASMELPPKEVVIHNEFFGDIERDFSTSIMSNTTRQFDTYVSRGVMLNNYANIFGLIMQMRQVANHPDLILKKHAQGGQNVLVCCICDETAEEPIRSRCHHEFCRECAKNYVKSFEQDASPDCPRCHIPLAIDFDQPDIEQDEDHVKKNSIINRIRMEDWTSSTKIEMLVYDLYKLRSRKQTHKSIVFSQFTSMLQLVEWRLRRAGFNTVMLDGSMSPAQRQRSIEYFMNNTHVEVFLVSLKAGGVALNLTEASRVFIVDPWWNPAAEWQSADRCHRIGQRRPCVITRLCIEDSVESRMVLLQEKKANMINGTINNDQVAMEKLTPEDMQFLFRGS